MLEKLTRKTFRPSSLGRISRCPGSVRLELLVPGRLEIDDEDVGGGPAAERGKLLHRLVGEPPGHKDEATLSSWDLKQLNFAREFHSALEAFYAQQCGPEKAERLQEQRLEVKECEGVPEHVLPAGTADWIWIMPGGAHAEILDHKTGPNELDEEIVATQIYTYAIMLFQARAGLKSVRVRVLHWNTEQEYEQLIPRASLPGMLGRLREIIANALQEEAAIQPSFSGCAYCPALSLCPGAASVARLDYGLVTTPKISEGPALANAIERAKVGIKHLEAFLEAAKAHLIQNPGAAPGWKLTKSNPRRVLKPWAYFQTLRGIVGAEKALEAFEPHVSEGIDMVARHRKEESGGTLKAHSEEFGAELLQSGIVAPGPDVYTMRPGRKEITG